MFEEFNRKPLSAIAPDSKGKPIASAGETVVTPTEIAPGNGRVGASCGAAGIAEHLKTLADLHVNGALTDEEYTKAKAVTLNGGAPL